MERELITIVTPTAPRATKRTRLAPRKSATLSNARIGLLDNNKPNADRFLESVGELLKQRYDGIELIAKAKDDPHRTPMVSVNSRIGAMWSSMRLPIEARARRGVSTTPFNWKTRAYPQ